MMLNPAAQQQTKQRFKINEKKKTEEKNNEKKKMYDKK